MSRITQSLKQLSSPIGQRLSQHAMVQAGQRRWQQLNGREQRLLSALAWVLLLAIVYFLLWQPSHQARIAAQQRLEAQQQQLTWVNQSIARYQALSQQEDNTSTATGSLTQRLNQAADNFEIALSRMQPQGDNMMVAVDEASFDQVLAFTAALESDYQLSIELLDVAKLDEPGQVRVRQLQVAEGQ